MPEWVKSALDWRRVAQQTCPIASKCFKLKRFCGNAACRKLGHKTDTTAMNTLRKPDMCNSAKGLRAQMR
jgi:hypothetical protein